MQFSEQSLQEDGPVQGHLLFVDDPVGCTVKIRPEYAGHWPLSDPGSSITFPSDDERLIYYQQIPI
jgi:hypothetical protein